MYENFAEQENTYELLYMSRQSSQYAFEALFKQYYRFMAVIVRDCAARDPLFRNYEDDFMLDAMLAFNEAVEAFREDQNAQFATFLGHVVRKRISNHMRNLYTRRRLYGEVISLDDQFGSDECYYAALSQADCFTDPVYVMKYNEACERLNDVLHSLNEIEMACARSWMNGESYHEGAHKNGIAERSWERRRLRVRNKICKAVKDE